MKINTAHIALKTNQGGAAIRVNPIDQLRRTVMSCMLWEDGFYEDGETIATRIKDLVAKCDPSEVAKLAIEARGPMRLRHAPLLLVRELARHPAKPKVANTLAAVIQRADELAEFVAIYWADGRQTLSAQVKKGLAKAFGKFDAYALAKYNRDGKVKLRDVLFLSHAKAKDEAQAEMWKQLIDGKLPAPDTWEVALSGGVDKKEAFERLISDGKLGYMALLRNLRNMADAGVSTKIIQEAVEAGAEKSKALPFRYLAAARAVPAYEPMLDAAMLKALGSLEKMSGKTIVLVDVSGSMDAQLSQKSDLTRLGAASALAVLVRGICSDARIFTFSNALVEVPPRHGMALVDAINVSQSHGGTLLGSALESVKKFVPDAERLIVITDEQSSDSVGGPGSARGYLINVATSDRAVGYGDWTRISGFSESVVQYIQALEKSAND